VDLELKLSQADRVCLLVLFVFTAFACFRNTPPTHHPNHDARFLQLNLEEGGQKQREFLKKLEHCNSTESSHKPILSRLDAFA
jgi:hypothetical protein